MGMNSEMKIPGSKKLSLATRELTPSTPMQGRPPHGTSPEEGSFLKVSVRAAHTGNPAALGGGPTQIGKQYTDLSDREAKALCERVQSSIVSQIQTVTDLQWSDLKIF